MLALYRSSVKDFLPKQRRKQKCIALANRSAEERNNQVGAGARCHEAGHKFGGHGVAPILLGIRNHSIREAMLIIDGNDREIVLVSDMTGERFEVGDDKVGLPFV